MRNNITQRIVRYQSYQSVYETLPRTEAWLPIDLQGAEVRGDLRITMGRPISGQLIIANDNNPTHVG